MIAGLDMRAVARALGGEVSRGAVLCPGPGHSRRDRSLSVRLSVNSPEGFIAFSHAGDDFRACRDYVRQRLGFSDDGWRKRVLKSWSDPAPTGADDADRSSRAQAIWDEGRDPRGTVAEHYLVNRGLALDEVIAGTAIRFHPACPWRDKEGGELLRVPAMIAALRAITGDLITGVHRTRLGDKGEKLGRRMLGQASGAAVKLDADEAVTLGLHVGEGIETTLAARMLGFRPAWALGSAGAVTGFPVLAGIEALTLLAENDDASRRAVDACAGRWHAAGREVTIVDPVTGSDLLDAMREAG